MNLPTFASSLNITKSRFAESLNIIEANVFSFCAQCGGVKNGVTNSEIGTQGVHFPSQMQQKLLGMESALGFKQWSSWKQSILRAVP